MTAPRSSASGVANLTVEPVAHRSLADTISS